MNLIIYFLCALVTFIGYNISIGMSNIDQDTREDEECVAFFLALVWPCFLAILVFNMMFHYIAGISQKIGKKIQDKKHRTKRCI